MSRTSPMPSVVSPRIRVPSKRSVLAASTARARSESSVASRQASPLNGSVTLSPRPPAARNAATAAAKPSSGARMRVYSRSSPVARAKAAWISGDFECAIGLPMTA